MKSYLRLLALLFAAVTAFSCNGSSTLLPNISGKAGEVVVVMERTNWEGILGASVREMLAGDVPYLAQREPLYSLVNVTPGGFNDMFKIHRNIIIFNINPEVENEGVVYLSDQWSQPQCVIVVNTKDNDSAMMVFEENGQRIIGVLEQAERNRIIINSKMYEKTELAVVVKNMVGGSPHFPSGYSLKKATEDFIWIADERQYSQQHILVYKYPAAEKENFTVESIISNRNRILQSNVPGQRDQSWMTTSDYIEPEVEFLKFRGRQFAQTRGFWEVYNDYMGGPFVSHSFYSKDSSEIVVLDAFVYAPRYDKRQYLRQVEAIIYSFEWEEEKTDDTTSEAQSK